MHLKIIREQVLNGIVDFITLHYYIKNAGALLRNSLDSKLTKIIS